MASYFLWQVQAKESTSPPFSSDDFSTTQLALNNTQEVISPKKSPVEVAEKKIEIKKQVGDFEHTEQKEAERNRAELAKKEARAKKARDLVLQQQEKEQAIIDEALKVETELAAKKAVAEKEKKLQQEKQEKATEALRIEAEKIRNEQALKERLQIEAREKELQQQKEEASLRSIEKDLEVISLHDEKIRIQQQAEEKKRRANQARLAAEKQSKAKLAEALIQKRRREFENNKNKQLQQPTPIKATTPKSREALQLKNQEYIKQKEVEKKRIVAEELKKQQIGKIKAKEAREKVIQKTITHQLVNYSKTFHRHVVQLKQKNQAIELLEQRKASSNDPNIIRNQKMLQSKKNDIEQRIDRLAVLYGEKLKKLCANKVIHSVAMPAKLTEVERIAYAVISQKLRNCSQPQALSNQSISQTLINRYLK